MNFPEKLQKLRKERGWSQEELANRITVSRQAVSKWELGTAVPDTDNIVQLSELFGVTTDYLIKDGLDSDEDIPAVARTAEKVKNAEQSRQLLIAGIITLVLGVIIVGVLLTLSQVIESYQKVILRPRPDDGDSPRRDNADIRRTPHGDNTRARLFVRSVPQHLLSALGARYWLGACHGKRHLLCKIQTENKDKKENVRTGGCRKCSPLFFISLPGQALRGTHHRQECTSHSSRSARP